jgi:hypothetical protein
MFETLFDVVMFGGVGFVAGWLGPTRPETVSNFYAWVASKLGKSA